jgi:L-asparagine oxygenase
MAKYIFNSFDNKILSENIDIMNNEPYEDVEKFINEVTNLASKIPSNIVDILKNFIKNGSETGFLLFQNVVLDDIIPETPPDNSYFIGDKTKYAKAIAIFNQILGEMIAYEGEGYGRLFQDMVPKKTLSDTQTSLGSNVELEIHTEQAFSKLKPDVLTLGCLRGDENAITYILPVHIILDNMDDCKKNLLRQPLWKIGVDLSFKMNFDQFIDGDIRGPMPIIYGSQEDPFLIFDQDLMTGINEEAEQLKKEIIDIYYKHRFGHVLKPGEIVFVDNRRAVHGRSPFKPKFNGEDRFIIRSFVTLDLDKSSYARTRNNRIIEARYS